VKSQDNAQIPAKLSQVKVDFLLASRRRTSHLELKSRKTLKMLANLPAFHLISLKKEGRNGAYLP